MVVKSTLAKANRSHAVLQGAEKLTAVRCTGRACLYFCCPSLHLAPEPGQLFCSTKAAEVRHGTSLCRLKSALKILGLVCSAAADLMQQAPKQSCWLHCLTFEIESIRWQECKIEDASSVGISAGCWDAVDNHFNNGWPRCLHSSTSRDTWLTAATPLCLLAFRLHLRVRICKQTQF
jgi:hypothetical protein